MLATAALRARGARPLCLAVGLALAVAALACTEPESGPPGELPPPPQCVPTGGGPHWLVEGEPLTFSITCATAGETRPGDAFEVRGLPAGAVYDPATATVTWTPGLDQAAVYQLELRVEDELITGRTKLGVADAFDTPGNVPVVDPLRYPEELGLPVMFVDKQPASTADEPVVITYRGRTWNALGNRHGASSLSYPQLSFTFQFDDEPFSDPDHGGGFIGKKHLVAISTFDDNSYVRQRLAYELWSAIDRDHLDIRAYSAVLYVAGQFHGLYTITDRVDDDLMATFGLRKQGNLYKAITHDANFDTVLYAGGAKTSLHAGYTKQEGLPPEGQAGAWDDLDALVTFAATSPAAQFASELPTRLSVADFRDWYVYVTFLLAEDSAGKNAYLYHDPAGGPWRYLPWDFNHSFGQAWQTSRTNPTAWTDFRRNNKIFARMLDDTTLGPALADRYRALLMGPLAEEAVMARVDAALAEIEPVAARNQRKWGQAYRTFSRWSSRTDFNDHAGEVAYLKNWLHVRIAGIRARYGLSM